LDPRFALCQSIAITRVLIDRNYFQYEALPHVDHNLATVSLKLSEASNVRFSFCDAADGFDKRGWPFFRDLEILGELFDGQNIIIGHLRMSFFGYSG